MWYLTETDELINFDNVASLRVKEVIREGEPKGYAVVALLPPGIHHLEIAEFKTPEEASQLVREIMQKMAMKDDIILPIESAP